MNHELSIRMLGVLQVEVGADTADFRTDALRVLLAYLAVHQGSPQRRDTLAGLLSPDRPNKEALTYLRNRLTRLRRALNDDAAVPPWFDVDRKQITLRAGTDIVVDVTRFDLLLNTIGTHSHRELAGCPTCLQHLQTAVDLVRGEFLMGLNFPSETWESWLVAQREHYQQRSLEAMTLLREALTVRKEWAIALEIAHRQLAIEPWLEAAHRTVMQAHYQAGDRNLALAQYDLCEQQLWDELGVTPEEETVTLWEQIKENTVIASAITAGGDNLPLSTGRFFGRLAEQSYLLERLVDPNYRLMTLVGAGGMGKTRLSIEVGRQVKHSFPDGVWFVPLDAIKGGGEQIKIAVGEAAGWGQHDKQLTGDQVLAILRDKRLLLILDNCEVALDDIDFIPEWLRRAPQIAILATSREPLNFQAEAVISLDGLPIGQNETGIAEALFTEQAQMARNDFTLTTENLAPVAQICNLVDGSPLGISLAAAWVRRRSLAQIVESIGRSLDFLITRQRDVDPRHRSMRAVFEASWAMLAANEQGVLAALSLFPTTFTEEAAKQIAAATLFDLDVLCEKSLLQQQQDSERYSMHSLVRQFAADKLSSNRVEISRAFTDYYYQYAQKHRDAYATLRPEWQNFSAGIAKAHELERWSLVIDFVIALDEPWFRQIRYQDMRAGLGFALEAAKALADEEAFAQMLLRLGEIDMELNDYQIAETHLGAALVKFIRQEDGAGIAHSKYLLGRIKNERSQDEEAVKLFEESRRIFDEREDWLGVSQNLNMLAVYQFKLYRDFQSAQTYLEQAADLQSRLSFTPTYIETLRFLARVQMMSGDFSAAATSLSNAATVSTQLNDIGEYGAVLFERLLLHKQQEQFDQALAVGYECLDSFKMLGSLRWEGLVKTQLGILHHTRLEFKPAQEHLATGLGIFEELGDSYEQAYSLYYLSKLYLDMDQHPLSLEAKQRAKQLNLTLKDPQLEAYLR